MLVDRYRLHGELGRGGFGTVWKAFDERLQRQVAVKILYRSATESGWSKAAARFWQEAITAGGLSSDHIVVVHDFGRVSHSDGPRDFLVMELLEGRPLSQIVACGVIPINQALSWAGQICKALEAAHRAGVIHRDIKPQNVIVNEDTSRLKVVDFGIAKSASLPLNLTETREVIGSWLYMAPERADLHATVDERSDLYSLGCLLYELLTGHPPFYDPDATPAAILHCHMRVTPPPPSHTRRELPEDLDRLVLEILSKDPAARPSKASEVRARLSALASVPQTAASSLAMPQPMNMREQAVQQRVQRAVQAGDAGQVLLARNLLQDISRESIQLYGAAHPCTLLARLEWVCLQGELDWDRGRAMAADLLADCEQALGTPHPLTLRCRSVHGHLTATLANPDRARILLASVIDDCTAHLGAEAIETLEARVWQADAVDSAGDHAEALRLNSQLMRDCERALGQVHSLTLTARLQHALCMIDTSGTAAAAVFYTPALSSGVARLGEDSSLVLTAQLGWLTKSTDSMPPARLKYELELLLPGVIRNYGDHAAPTFVTRGLIAVATATEGQTAALDQLGSLIASSSVALGAKSTTTLALKGLLAECAGLLGNADKARDLMWDVRAELEEVLGSDASLVRDARAGAERWAKASRWHSRIRRPSWLRGFQ
ncbi:serine/threonine-protein kinase [Streptomyces sp. NBC_01443]|uniref:serine/threonine-protein kinase n=1 Tax=Streptomyces sp. NBC_01443 TaxID=2903868 RepID=UPI002257E8A3|nr:serine/threonine-protein kinase [Streptomyces sp. NBC_01443]MCX4625285.1 serine/threonine protein kinase [Streptomyces sp. NBC_01443]